MTRPPLLFVVGAVLVVVSLSACMPVEATVSSTRSAAAAYNLVRNAGFESSSTELLYWQGTAAPDDDAHTGVVSAKLGDEKENKATTTLIQTFSFEAETVQRCYTIQFWAKQSAAYNPNQNALNASLIYHDVVTLLTKNTGSATQLPVMNSGLKLTASADDARGWELFSFFQCLASVPSKNSQDELRLEIGGNGYLIDDVSVSLQHCPDDGQFEDFLRGLLKEYNVPSLAVAAVKNGVTICAMAVGTKIAQKSLPVTVTDRYHIGSDGKAMTAILAGIAVEAGKLKWDTRVTEVFPELVPLMTEEFKRINLTQLLSHSSGIGQAGDIAVFTDLVPELDCGDTERNLEAMRYEVLRFLAPRSLATPPGTQWSYSNVGYMVAGAMVERVLDQPYERLITTRVFDGLHLLTAGLGCQVDLGRIDAAIAHKKYPNGTLEPFLAGPHCDNPAVLAPAGIAHMSLLDFANWAGWSAGQGKRGPHIVTPATIIKTHTGVIEANPPNPPPGTPPPGMYAMGWGLRAIEWAPAPLLYHAGSNNKNLVNAWLDPKEDFAMVTMTNTADPQSEEALIKIAKQMYTKLVAGGKA